MCPQYHQTDPNGPPLPPRPLSAQPSPINQFQHLTSPYRPNYAPAAPPLPERPRSAYSATDLAPSLAQPPQASLSASQLSKELPTVSPQPPWSHWYGTGEVGSLESGMQQLNVGCNMTLSFNQPPPSTSPFSNQQYHGSLGPSTSTSQVPPRSSSYSFSQTYTTDHLSPLAHSSSLGVQYPSTPRIQTAPIHSMSGSSQSHHPQPLPSSSSVTSLSATAPPITYPLPTVENLGSTSTSLHTLPDSEKLAWAQDVLRILDRQIYPAGQPTDFCADPAHPIDAIPEILQRLLDDAIPIIISFTTHSTPALAALATYLKAKLLSSGACPDYLPRDPRQAFKDFESAARKGENRGWFRLGRDYEGVGEVVRARDCFERGVKRGDCECTYRMGMALLLGQLGLNPDPSIALPLLKAAAESSSIDVPHPSYVYGMLLSSELLLPPALPLIPHHHLLPADSPPSQALSDQQRLAKDSIERAAYFCHPPAQLKMGNLYEHAALTLTYDPLMSVQWYSLASQSGETEADMALSKWFLCGAEPHFGKNEQLARVFAEKAARKGLPNGCFAMGYYYELGIGGRKDTDQARKWYHRAAKLDNPDAISRLAALSAPNPHTISLQEHQSRLNDTLVRKRTAAKVRSENAGAGRQRRRGEMERAKIEADRAARMAAGYAGTPQPTRPSSTGAFRPAPPGQAYPSAMSPAPRVGEIMSPGVFHPAMMTNSNTFPRPPIPHHAFSSSTGGSTVSGASSGTSTSYPPSGVRNSFSVSLQDGGPVDLPIKAERDRERERREKIDKGPQTFAEMGFVSKPVEDEGCRIM